MEQITNAIRVKDYVIEIKGLLGVSSTLILTVVSDVFGAAQEAIALLAGVGGLVIIVYAIVWRKMAIKKEELQIINEELDIKLKQLQISKLDKKQQIDDTKPEVTD